ncbi:hypothetical protein ACWGJ9_09575 [Curtobacterium citreum]
MANSVLEKLRSAVNNVAKDSKKTAGLLQRHTVDLQKSASQVSSVLQGSSKNTDQKVIASINAAEVAVKEAMSKLQDAARTAEEYGRGL